MGPNAEELLEKAIERHGGQAAFDAIESIRLELPSFGGLIPAWKGLGRSFTLPKRVDVRPRELQSKFHYPGAAVDFKAGTIKQEGGASLPNYRQTFRGFHKLRRWTDFDACYFFGYAFVNYASLPFLLQDTEIRNFAIQSDGSFWLDALFPEHFDTHSRRQRFWFNASGLLVRHDYRADILGPIFWGAHFSGNYRTDLPIPIAETRSVYVRLGKKATPIRVLYAQLKVQSVETT